MYERKSRLTPRQQEKLIEHFVAWSTPKLESMFRVNLDSYGTFTEGSTAARHEIALLSHAYTKAVEWVYVERHPFKWKIRLKQNKRRERYVEDWEVAECLPLSSKHKKGSIKLIQAYIRLKLLTGLRKSDLLRIKEDGICIHFSLIRPFTLRTFNDIFHT